MATLYATRLSGACAILLLFLSSACSRDDSKTTTQFQEAVMAGGAQPCYIAGDDPVANFTVSAGNVDILATSLDAQGHLVLAMRWNDPVPVCRTVYFAPEASPEGWPGFNIQSYAGSELKIGWIAQLDFNNGNRWRMVEWNPDDRLEVNHMPAAEPGNAIEEYDWNGVQATFEVSLDPIAKVSGPEFAAYYSGSTLDNNIDGTRLGSLVTHQPFLEWMEIEVQVLKGVAEPYTRVIDDPVFQSGCSLALTCAIMKCPWGGFANFLCVGCAGTFTTCLMIIAMCLYMDC